MANDQFVDVWGSGFFMLFCVFVMLLWLAATAFWLWMLIDCIKNEGDEGNKRVIWAVLMVILGPIVSLVYYFARRPQRIAELGR